MTQTIDIGSRLELFVDDYLIERMDGLELRLNHPVRREAVLYFDRPWEGPWSGYQTIVQAIDGYRMYYRGVDYSRKAPEYTCVALSDDGIHWTKPELGLYESEGNSRTNIVWAGPGAHAFSPFIDTNPDCRPEERFKAVGPNTGDAKQAGLLGFASTDGFKWSRLREEPLITDGHFDSHNLAFWDSLRGEYVCYFRMFRGGFYPGGVRDIKRSTSKDFINWTEPEWLQYTHAPEEQLYTNSIIPYFRAPHIYLGFPKRYHRDRKDHGGDGLSDGVFMSSRDGLTFRRWHEAFMRPGPDPENWVDRNQLSTWGMLELKPGEISLYYLEHNYVPTHNLMRATIRTDGFVSLHAGGDMGTMLTKPITFTGSEMVINYSTSGMGSVRVEIQDENGTPIPDFALDDCPEQYGDSIEHVVRWNSGTDVSRLAGKPIALRFELVDGDVYSIRFR